MIKIFKQRSYKNCPILIRQTDRFTFEYLLVFEGKFYGTFIKNKLKWNQLHRYFMKETATQKEVNGMVHFLEKAAETTIDVKLKEKEDKKEINPLTTK